MIDQRAEIAARVLVELIRQNGHQSGNEARIIARAAVAWADVLIEQLKETQVAI